MDISMEVIFMAIINIGSVMSKDVLTANKKDSIISMLERLQKHRIGAVVVINDENTPIGIITERDIIQSLVAYKNDIFTKQVQDIMSAPVLTVEPEEDIESAAILMTLHSIRRIPVTKENKLVGFITYRDITNALRKSYSSLEEKAEHFEDMANKDPLTGLFNKRFISKELKDQFKSAKETGTSMTVMMLDIDFFKKVNDTYGHLCGDYVLKELSNLMQAKSREINIVGRYGGEEFIIIGPISDKKSSFFFAERLRAAVEAAIFVWEGREFKITISIGVCVWNPEIEEATDMIKLADRALYTAKENGRNQVRMAEMDVV
jgi:diguanylate cyclase (GGDEF)-like protein